MSLDRRSALKLLASGAAVAATPSRAEARERRQVPADAVGLLYDSTLCIGCQTCVVACREANGLPYENPTSLYDNPVDLTAKTKNIIKLLPTDSGPVFMKMQCMHCVDPACVSACMLGSFKKREFGIVTWDADKCVGCRYCQVACPFNVPKFEWDSATPKLVKCELCNHRLADGQEPACTEVCPREAVIYGTHEELLREAHRRLEAEPEKYEPKVYGEEDGGGTQVIYLAAAGVPFTALGLPDLGRGSVPHLPETVQHTIYNGFIAPVVLYGLLAGVVWRNRRGVEGEEEVTS